MPVPPQFQKKDEKPVGEKKPAEGKPPSMKEMEATGRPLVDDINKLMDTATAGGLDNGELPPGGGGEGDPDDVTPLVEALDVTPEHAKALCDAAKDMPGYEGMSKQDLADKLASDPMAREDLERKVEAKKGTPKAAEKKMTPVGGESETGVAAWPGSPARKEPEGGSADLGNAPWPK